jgi:DNA-binding NtrC family response regulator
MPFRILIVEDEEDTANVIRNRLESRGREAQCAADGAEGLEKFKQQDFDAVILDLKMPRMGGMEVLRQIRSLSAYTPVIILTGYGSKETAIEAIRLRVFDYVEKPITDWEGFLDTVQRAAETHDREVRVVDKWVRGLSPEEQQRPLIFEGRRSYSPQQLLDEIRSNTEFGKRQRLNVTRALGQRRSNKGQ